MEKPLTKNIDFKRGPLNLKDYKNAGGYQSVKKSLKELEPKQVQQIIKDSNLKGRGSAGFGTGMNGDLFLWVMMHLNKNICMQCR